MEAEGPSCDHPRSTVESLDAGVRQSAADVGEDPLAVATDCLGRLLERGESRVRRPVEPLIQSLSCSFHLLEVQYEGQAHALDFKQMKRAREALDEWLNWASHSRLAPFKKAAKTIRRHREGILAYIRSRLTNARVEGFNGRTRMVARRAFGFHSAAALIGMLFLCCGGISLNPPLP